jgi:hypothetical protein
MMRNFAVASGQQVSSAPRGWRGREEPLSETKRDYRVSPAKPPVHSRFKKGQSGNRRGPRPKSRPALLEVRVQTVGGPQVALSEVLIYKICEWRPSSGYGRPL